MAGYLNICIDDLNLNILYFKKKFDFYHIQYVQMIFYKIKKSDKAHSGSHIWKTQESTKNQWI